MKKLMGLFVMSCAMMGAYTVSAQLVNGGFKGPGIKPVTVHQALQLKDDTPVVLVGQIERSLGNEKYLFKDTTGTVTVEIDDDDWHGVQVTPENTVEIHGEVDKEMFKETKIDIDRVVLK